MIPHRKGSRISTGRSLNISTGRSHNYSTGRSYTSSRRFIPWGTGWIIDHFFTAGREICIYEDIRINMLQSCHPKPNLPLSHLSDTSGELSYVQICYWTLNIPHPYVHQFRVMGLQRTYEVLSRGILWVAWGVRHKMLTWFSRARFITSKFQEWLKCPSRIRSTRDSAVCFTFSKKCSKLCTKIWLWIQPDGWHTGMDPSRAPLINWLLRFLRGNTIMDGTKFTLVLVQLIAVTNDRRSAEEMDATCSFPFLKITRGTLLCTMLRPVLSKL